MMCAKFLEFSTASPFPHMDLICVKKLMQPPLLRPLFHDPPPMRTSYLEVPTLIMESAAQNFFHIMK